MFGMTVRGSPHQTLGSTSANVQAEELEIDEEADDAWEGWDEPEDTDESRKENHKGFRFPCCNGDGNASGCKSSVHRPDRTKRLRSGARS